MPKDTNYDYDREDYEEMFDDLVVYSNSIPSENEEDEDAMFSRYEDDGDEPRELDF